jgi:hypothetical protein
MMQTFVTVRYQVEGFHCWPDAPEHLAYLRARHRHLFHVEAKVEVFADDREIEFHDLLRFCKAHFAGGELGSWSCERMASHLADNITARFPGRAVTVSVFEDGEVGATYCIC